MKVLVFCGLATLSSFAFASAMYLVTLAAWSKRVGGSATAAPALGSVGAEALWSMVSPRSATEI
jgi:hypothetical protein